MKRNGAVVDESGVLFDRDLEEDFLSALGWCATYLHSSGHERYTAWLSEAFQIDPGDLFDPMFRDCFERMRKLILGEQAFSWQLLRHDLLEAGRPIESVTILVVDMVIAEGGGRPYEIPALRKRLEEMGRRRREGGVKPRGFTEKSYEL